MGQLFKGWRRKIGFVTLLLALSFMGGWIRSREIHDRVWYVFPDAIYLIYSHQGCLLWQCERPSSRNMIRMNRFEHKWLSQYAPALRLPISHDEFVGYDVDWQWKWSDFNFGTGSYALTDWGMEDGFPRPPPVFEHLTAWTVPYWSIVLPLTLLSAFLLLTTPRKSTPKIISEPIPEKVA